MGGPTVKGCGGCGTINPMAVAHCQGCHVAFGHRPRQGRWPWRRATVIAVSVPQPGETYTAEAEADVDADTSAA